MVNQIDIKAVPDELTTVGCMRIKEIGQEIDLRFLMDPDFRGKLISVTWNVQNSDDKTVITADDTEQWAYFKQVGSRPEIVVNSTWIGTLGLTKKVTVLRIKFEFDTFRFNPVWYAYLYLKQPYGDLNPPYKVPKKDEPTPTPPGPTPPGPSPTPGTGEAVTVDIASDNETMYFEYVQTTSDDDDNQDDNNG